MKLVGIIDEDFVNYKKPSMVLEFPYCHNFKCDRDCGMQVCQNNKLASAPKIDISPDSICVRYKNNPITQAIVCQGLEPFDSLSDLYEFIEQFRDMCDDDIVIYTGYKEEEIYPYIEILKERYKNIIIKFGRFKPNSKQYYDDILGVKLASTNQYARKIC